MSDSTKLLIMNSHYLLQIGLHPTWVDCLVLDHSSAQLSKHHCRLALDGTMPKLDFFGDSAGVFELLKDSDNYSVDLEKLLVVLRWTVVAGGFKRDCSFQVPLQPAELTEIDSLKLENVFLKQRLSNYEDPKENEAAFKWKSSNQLEIKTQLRSLKDFEQVNLQASSDKNLKAELAPKVVELQVRQKDLLKTKPINKRRPRKVKDEDSQKQDNDSEQTKPKRGRKKKSELALAQEQVERKQDSLESKVKVVFENGDYYFGEMKDNLYHGQGEYYSHTNGAFKGLWENGRANGYGQSRDLFGNKHSGFYVDDKRNGHGMDEYKNGEKYEGNFNMDCKEGLGKYSYANGDVYHGYWKNDLYHGKGKQFYHDGSLYEGSWVCDEKDGEGVYTDTNGTKWRQIWKAGVKISERQIR